MTPLEDEIASRIARQRALARANAAELACATLALTPRARLREARAAAEEMANASADAATVRARVRDWRDAQRRAEDARAKETTRAMDSERRARAREATVAREARETRIRARAASKARRRAEAEAANARAANARATSRAANEAMISLFQARDAQTVRRRRDAIAALDVEIAERELRLETATARARPFVHRSRERLSSWTEAAARRFVATTLERERVEDLDVFARAARQGWVLDAHKYRRTAPRWRVLDPRCGGVVIREY